MLKKTILFTVLCLGFFHAHSEAYFVHGTKGSSKSWDDEIRAETRIIFGCQAYGNEVELFDWSGANNTFARKIAAEELLAHIVSVRVKYHITEKTVTLVGHSHGGNVILLASKKLHAILGDDVEINIVTLNTPNVVGGAKLEDPGIHHYHIYCPKDNVVPHAGFNKTGIRDKSKVNMSGTDKALKGELSLKKDLESGKQGSTFRTFDSAYLNIPYKDQYFLKGFRPMIHLARHRGWLPKNFHQWVPDLQKAVTNII
ncbi:MAG: hypothetical protein KDC85_09260 [Saprospiraceae bacterium]|nr:hypothetical protein [Saprospiraceae bacterium]MCB9325432.1 hypothetical protein [Lewinellaceae bacterium]